MAFPIGFPRPVVKATIWQPAATRPVTDAGSFPGVSMNDSPGALGLCPYARTSTRGVVPPLSTSPRAFSSTVEMPPRTFPGVGCLFMKLSPVALSSRSHAAIVARSRSRTSGVAARSARTCSAPSSSLVSARMTCAPRETIRSLKAPMAGLAAMPEVASEPPHSRPMVSAVTGHGTR